MRIEHKLLIPLFLLTISNTLTAIDIKASITIIIVYILFFIAVGMIIQIKKVINNKNTMPVIMLAFSIVSTIMSNGFAVLAGIFFLSFSLFIVELPKKIYWIYGVIYIPLLMVNFYLHKYTSSRTIGYMAGVLFIFIIYQHYIHPKKKIKSYIKVIEKPDIAFNPNEDVVNIVYHKGNGCDFYKISDILKASGKEITPARCRRKVREEMNRLKINNLEEFIFRLVKNGYYPDILPKTNTDNKEYDNL